MGAINKALFQDGAEQTWQTELSLLARHNVYFETCFADHPGLTVGLEHYLGL